MIPKSAKKKEVRAVESAKIAGSKARKMKEGKVLLRAEEAKLLKLPEGAVSKKGRYAGGRSVDVRYWQRWLQWRSYLGNGGKEGKTAAEVALYLTFLAYKSGNLAAARAARWALRFHARRQGEEGDYMKDPLIQKVMKDLEGDFNKPRQLFAPKEMKKIIKYFLREKISQKLVDLKMACLLLLLYLSGVGKFGEVAAIELESIKMLETGSLMITRQKGKRNQLAKTRIILPKLENAKCQDLDITSLLTRYLEKLDSQGVQSRFLFPSCRSIKKGRKKYDAVLLLDKPIAYEEARKSLREAVKMTRIKTVGAALGLRSCGVSALMKEANEGKFSELQLQNLESWAQMSDAARFFLPRAGELNG